MIKAIPTHEQKLIRSHLAISSPAACLKVVLASIQEIGVDSLTIAAHLAEGCFTVQSPNFRISDGLFTGIKDSIFYQSQVSQTFSRFVQSC